MTDNRCQTCRELIDSLLLGTLDEGQRIFVEVHLEQCADCREALNLARHLRRTMRDLQAACTTPHCESDALVRLAIDDRTVGADERKQLLDHVSKCRQCRDDFETIRGVSRDLGLASPNAGASVNQASLMDRVRGVLMRPLPAVGVVAGAGIIVAVILLVGGEGPEAPPQVTVAPMEADALRRGPENQDQEPIPNTEQQASVSTEPLRDEKAQLALAAEGIEEEAPAEDLVSADVPASSDPGGPPEQRFLMLDTSEQAGDAQGTSRPVAGTYHMDLEGPEARVFILDLAEAFEASQDASTDHPASQVPILRLTLKTPRDPAHLIVTRPPEMLGLSSVDVELAKAGAESTRWLWPDLPLPTGDGPFKVSVPPEILEEGDYLISFKTAGESGSTADRLMKFRLHVSCSAD